MTYDVVVVGAGPSGSTAAKTLAEKGINVLLVDKEKFPREKACGGGVPMRTLDRFSYIKKLKSIESYSFGGFVYAPSMEYTAEINKDEPVLAMVLRSKFDNELVQLAIDEGAAFQDKKTVTDIKIHKNHAQLIFNDTTSISTNLIIGADGFHSTIAQKLDVISKPRQKGICILKEFLLDKQIVERLYTPDRLCYIHSKINGIKGYGWVFPKHHHVNVGIISYDTVQSLKQKKLNLRMIFSKYLNDLKHKGILPMEANNSEMKGGLVPLQPLSKTYFNRVLLCGDAAGLINPISGEGIYYALVSGQLAGIISAESIHQQNTSASFLSTYEKKWKQEFGKEINLFLKSKKQWGKQGNKMVKMMNQDPEFAELIFVIMVGKKSVSDLKWKIIKRYLHNYLPLIKK